jgi:hypothetical protein
MTNNDLKGVASVRKIEIRHRRTVTQTISTSRYYISHFNLSHFRAFPILHGYRLCGNGRVIWSIAKATVTSGGDISGVVYQLPGLLFVSSITLRQVFHFSQSASQMVCTLATAGWHVALITLHVVKRNLLLTTISQL